jgi:predicted O-linked N-acetylglucosamine transferase (SPINDLY family)
MAEMTIEQKLNVALEHHKSGRVAEAETIYRDMLSINAQHPDALHLLGVIAVQRGQASEGEQLIRRAIGVNAQCAAFYSNLGMALGAQNRWQDALGNYQTAVKLDPNYAQAYENMGVALERLGRGNEAVAAYGRSLQLNPQNAALFNTAGSLLQNMGRAQDALGAFSESARLVPDAVEPRINMAVVLNSMGKAHEAVAECEKLLAKGVDFGPLYNTMGNALQSSGRMAEAVKAYQNTLRLMPDYAIAYNNMGAALAQLGKTDDARASFKKACELDPNYAEAYNNLAVVTRDMDEAMALLERAVALNPTYVDAFNNLGNAHKERGDLDRAMVAYRRSVELRPNPNHHSNLLLCMQYSISCDGKARLEECQRWEKLYGALGQPIAPHINSRDPERKLKVGYVSADFRRHPVGRFMHGLLKHHDRNAVEITCYSMGQQQDDWTQRLKDVAQHWRHIANEPEGEAAKIIRDDGIDILVDLGMHTCGSSLRLFAAKPAPVQLCYLAFVGTTGLSTMDYRLTDPYLEDRDQPDPWCSEKPVWLPDTYWCYTPLEFDVPVSEAPFQKNGHITFGSLNNFCKFNERVIVTWSQILRQNDSFRLYLHARGGGHREQLLQRFEREGITRERITFMGYVSEEEYLKAYANIDIALDPFPYAGGTTTCDALWMGVPVISIKGEVGVARAGLSVLTNAGWPELVTNSLDEYVKLALQLAEDPQRLREIRKIARPRMHASKLMEADSFARGVENAYRTMWREWCAKGK